MTRFWDLMSTFHLTPGMSMMKPENRARMRRYFEEMVLVGKSASTSSVLPQEILPPLVLSCYCSSPLWEREFSSFLVHS